MNSNKYTLSKTNTFYAQYIKRHFFSKIVLCIINLSRGIVYWISTLVDIQMWFIFYATTQNSIKKKIGSFTWLKIVMINVELNIFFFIFSEKFPSMLIVSICIHIVKANSFELVYGYFFLLLKK